MSSLDVVRADGADEAAMSFDDEREMNARGSEGSLGVAGCSTITEVLS